MDFKWVRSDMDLYHIDRNDEHIVTVSNSGNLDKDFFVYAQAFFEAAERTIHYLGEDAAEERDIAKLDLWYFAMVYLYRQSLELLLKACIFQTVTDNTARKEVVGNIRHDLKQAFEYLIEVKGLSISDNENAKWTMEFLSDISRIDSESDMFRYPFGSNLKALFENQTHISLVATHDNMNKAYVVIKSVYDSGVIFEKVIEANAPQLIVNGGYYYQQSVVGYKYSQHAFFPFYSSYEKVGNFLRDIICKEKKFDLFMPMCYLYRNAVELGLKRLIVEDSHISYHDALRIIHKKKHSILGLWNSIADEIKKYADVPEDDTTCDDAQKYIQAFHNVDPSSDLFRYPCNKKMESYFLNARKLDVKNVSSCFEELCNFLDCVDGMLSDVKDFEAEMASYYDN